MGKKAPQEEPDTVENTEQAEQEEIAAETEEAELSPEEQLLAEVDKARSEAKAHQEQYLRTLADMENLRKRTQREKEELAKFANENILREILPVIDNLERAIEHAEQSEMGETGAGLLEGVQMTLTQFSQVLDRFGVKPVESLGQPFDPNLHQAMGQMESEEYPANSVAQQMQKGYQLNDRLLRPAMVMVAKAPEVKEPEENNEETDEK
ncbi:molecular chaperone GrpE [Malonomonas rubra DSM 5091]|uniref:Protein GrpE n=1 Tax=Malonomonas rubra DSM 5091 TaxID=1122189 RepID=A0A1M6HB83_MALRU|nr:nucleotide exchange factor GrpE [Malonomonas rubra]SHJ19369.1 molecular chaperone GrpE [Malonomonas rubra DSM 5091]